MACKLHIDDPSVPLANQARRLHADVEQAQRNLHQLKNRKDRPATGVQVDTPVDSESEAEPPINPQKRRKLDKPVSSITDVCDVIMEDKGRLNRAWESPSMRNLLVEHHEGFKAYSDYVVGWYT